MDGTVHMWRRRESSALQRAVPAGQGRSHWLDLRMASGLADAALRARAGGRSDERLRWRRRLREGQLGEDGLDAAAPSRVADGVGVRRRFLEVYHRLVPQLVRTQLVTAGARGVGRGEKARGVVGGGFDGGRVWLERWCGGEGGWCGGEGD